MFSSSPNDANFCGILSANSVRSALQRSYTGADGASRDNDHASNNPIMPGTNFTKDNILLFGFNDRRLGHIDEGRG